MRFFSLLFTSRDREREMSEKDDNISRSMGMRKMYEHTDILIHWTGVPTIASSKCCGVLAALCMLLMPRTPAEVCPAFVL